MENDQLHSPNDFQYLVPVEYTNNASTIADVASAVGAAVVKLPAKEIQHASAHIEKAMKTIYEIPEITSDTLYEIHEATQFSATHAGSAAHHLNTGASKLNTYLQVIGSTGINSPETENYYQYKAPYPKEMIYEAPNTLRSYDPPKVLLHLDESLKNPNFFKDTQVAFSTPPGRSPEDIQIEPVKPEPETNIRTTITPQETAPRELSVQERVDKRLLGGFTKAAETLDVSSLAIINEGSRRPRNLGDFSIIPLKSKYDIDESILSCGQSVEIPKGVRATYGDASDSVPFLDTSIALGLVKADRNAAGELTGTSWLIAVAAAGVDKQGNILIEQIQDVTGEAGKSTPADPKARFKTGLHSGFAWRDTLVAAWETIAVTTRASSRVVIQSAKNNTWPAVRGSSSDSTDGKPRGYPGYDAVAKRLGYTLIPPFGDWAKTLPTPETTGGDGPAENGKSTIKNSQAEVA